MILMILGHGIGGGGAAGATALVLVVGSPVQKPQENKRFSCSGIWVQKTLILQMEMKLILEKSYISVMSLLGIQTFSGCGFRSAETT